MAEFESLVAVIQGLETQAGANQEETDTELKEQIALKKPTGADMERIPTLGEWAGSSQSQICKDK
jgi:hypothetical protein